MYQPSGTISSKFQNWTSILLMIMKLTSSKKCQELIKSGMKRQVRKYQTDVNFNWLAIDGIRVTTDAQEDRIVKELSPSLEAYIDQIVDTINGTSERTLEIVTNDLASNEACAEIPFTAIQSSTQYLRRWSKQSSPDWKINWYN